MARDIYTNIHGRDTELDTLLKNFKKTLARITRSVQGKRGVAPHTAEDLAMRGVEYALRPHLLHGAPQPASVDDLAALAVNKANLLAIDLNRYEGNHPLSFTLDESPTDDEGCPRPNSTIERFSVESYRRADDAYQDADLAAHVYSHRGEIYDALGVKPRTRRIFEAYFLENRSTDEVCRSFGITPNDLYVTIHRMKKLLSDRGRLALAA